MAYYIVDFFFQYKSTVPSQNYYSRLIKVKNIGTLLTSKTELNQSGLYYEYSVNLDNIGGQRYGIFGLIINYNNCI